MPRTTSQLGMSPRLGADTILRVVALAVILLGVSLTLAPRAHAYDGGAAARYADAYAINRNCSGYPCDLPDDCTDFVSQALHAGGFSMVGTGGSTTDDHNWFIQSCWWCIHKSGGTGYNWSYSWAVAPDLYNFLMWHYPGGWNWGTQSGTSAGFYSGADVGDVLFFNWGDGKGISHADIQTAFGTDPTKGWYGDLVDQHSVNLYHAFWSLEPYNSKAATTTITLVHIDPNNH